MSFILDALKKSESDRQRQASPGLIEVSAIPPRPRFPRWAIAVGALLAINLAVLIVVLTRGDRRAEAGPPASAAAADPASGHSGGGTPSGGASPASQVAAGPAAGSAAPGANFSPMDAPVYAPEIPVPPDSDGHNAASAATAAPEPRLTRAAPANRVSGSSQAANTVHESEENLPTLEEMNASSQRGIPELHLDIHVYDANAASRFVFINMRKYREGATLQEGPSIERITRAGVVLSYQGTRFILPRQ